jgi:hypothetical protein
LFAFHGDQYYVRVNNAFAFAAVDAVCGTSTPTINNVTLGQVPSKILINAPYPKAFREGATCNLYPDAFLNIEGLNVKIGAPNMKTNEMKCNNMYLHSDYVQRETTQIHCK